MILGVGDKESSGGPEEGPWGEWAVVQMLYQYQSVFSIPENKSISIRKVRYNYEYDILLLTICWKIN